MSSPIIQFQNHQPLVIDKQSTNKDGKCMPVRLIVLVPNSRTHSPTSSVSENTFEFLLKLASLPGLRPNASTLRCIHFLRILGGIRSWSSHSRCLSALGVFLLLGWVHGRINVATATAIWWDQQGLTGYVFLSYSDEGVVECVVGFYIFSGAGV